MLAKKSNIPFWKQQFWKLLYKIYSSNVKGSGILRHRITPLGYIAGIALVFALSLRLGSNDNTLFGFIACVAALIMVAFVSVFFRRAKISVKRSLPRMGTVGQECSYTIDVMNHSRTPLSSAYLRELPVNMLPSQDVFVYSVEPGEQERNLFDRLFIVYRWIWLTENRTSFYWIDSHPIRVSGKKSVSVQINIIPRRRGLLPLANIKLILPDPLYLFQRCKNVEQTEDSIIVFPKRYQIRSLNQAGEAHNQVGGEGQSNQIGESSEFVSLRDYRSGDPLKHLDWKSWAKTGQPVVREYEDVFYPRHGLILDTGAAPTYHEEFEEAVSVASSFACSMDTNQGLLDLVFIQQGTQILTVGKGVNPLDEMMEALACAEMETNPNWDELTKKVLDLTSELSSCIMVFAQWSEERAKLANMVAAAGVSTVVFLVSSDEQKSREVISENSVAGAVHLLKVGAIQEGLDQVLGP